MLDVPLFGLEEVLSQYPAIRNNTYNFTNAMSAGHNAGKQSPADYDTTQQMLSAVCARMSDGLLILDHTLTILHANPAFCQWIGQPVEKIAGRFITDVLVSNEIVPAIRTLANDPTASNQVELTVNQPVRRSLLAQVATLRTNQLHGWMVVLRDQSERQRAQYQKLEFINIAAHELRTPLMAIMGFTTILLKALPGTISEQHLDFLQTISGSTQQLKTIIDEMLLFANINQGHIRSQGISECSLTDLLNDVLIELEPRAYEKRVTLHQPSTSPSIQLVVDTTLLRVALNQLILNAIIFNTPGGSVQITISQERERVNILITDTGIGIPPTDRDAVFQPFFQVEDHHTRQVGGIGLGLSIARRAVVQLGGTLTVESVLGAGTTCSIQLPLHHSANNEFADLLAKLEESQRQSRTYAHEVQALSRQLQQHTLATLTTITELLEARDDYFCSHTNHVTTLAIRIAKQMGLSALELHNLEIACRIHDIGKIGIPEALLNKTDPLTLEEELLMQQHVALGRAIVEPLQFLHTAMPIAFSHHERWDGGGYPDGLVGDEIPLGGRILAVADAYEALVSPRPYRVAHTHEQALGILRAGKGSHWDPAVIEAFLTLMNTSII